MEKTIRFLDGEYFGPVDANNMPHGFGQYTSAKGVVYSTEFVHGEAHGAGVYETPEGDNVYCTWVHGLIQGRAEFYAKNGGHYEAYFKNNKLITELKRIK